jgi:hypothetical protein
MKTQEGGREASPAAFRVVDLVELPNQIKHDRNVDQR